MSNGGADITADTVIVPDGTVFLEYAAFRGRSELKHVVLPDSLEEIGDLAFSCSGLRDVFLPEKCMQLSELSLRTGPESLYGPASPYRSTLELIDVAAGNPVFSMVGPVLCRHVPEGEGGRLEAFLCPGSVDEVHLPEDVFQVLPSAFAGTYRIGKLRFCEGLRFVDGCGLAPNATCDAVTIDLEDPAGGYGSVELRFPHDAHRRSIMRSTEGMAEFELPVFLAAYDEAVLQESDHVQQAALMAARMAKPVSLPSLTRERFEELLAPVAEVVCAQFAAQGNSAGLEDLVDAEMLDGRGIDRAIDLLADRRDSQAVAMLLELKRSRFEGNAWDYGL